MISRVLTGEFAWCPFIESPVRTTLIVFLSPEFDKLLSADILRMDRS